MKVAISITNTVEADGTLLSLLRVENLVVRVGRTPKGSILIVPLRAPSSPDEPPYFALYGQAESNLFAALYHAALAVQDLIIRGKFKPGRQVAVANLADQVPYTLLDKKGQEPEKPFDPADN